MEVITATSNARVKAWKKLAKKKERQKQGQYLLDGWHLVKEALLAGQKIATILVVADFKHVSELTAFDFKGEMIQISDNVAKALSETPSPQGIFALVEIPVATDIEFADISGAWLFLDGVQDPGNIGTMVRTADAAGFSGVVFGEGSADLYQPKVVRSMQGSQFHLQLHAGNLSEWIAAFQAKKFPVFGTELNEAARNFREVGQHQNFALIMGNEGNGMRADHLAQTSLNLYIPLAGNAESLNVAVAAGVLMFQLKA